MRLELTPCKWCRARIWWGETEAGERIPMNEDATPWFSARPRSACVVTERPGDVPLVRVLKQTDERPPGAPLYTAHFSRCSGARKAKQRKCTVGQCSHAIRPEEVFCARCWRVMPAELRRELTAGPLEGCLAQKSSAWWEVVRRAGSAVSAALIDGAA